MLGKKKNKTEAAATTPPLPKAKKPFYKKWWFWAIVVFVLIGVIGNSGDDKDEKKTADSAKTEEVEKEEVKDDKEKWKEYLKEHGIDKPSPVRDDKTGHWYITTMADQATAEDWAQPYIETYFTDDQGVYAVVNFTLRTTSKLTKISDDEYQVDVYEYVDKEEHYAQTLYGGMLLDTFWINPKTGKITKEESEPIAEEVEASAPEEEVSREYKNALRKAESYAKMMHMSKQGIYDQLTSEYGEGFPADAAQHAIDNLKADFNANALEKAKQYSEQMSMSDDAIYDQLVSDYGEKFTPEEAQYAIDHLDD